MTQLDFAPETAPLFAAVRDAAYVIPRTWLRPLQHEDGSPVNPRRRFDPVRLRELADTIEEHGILEPLLVRLDPEEAGPESWTVDHHPMLDLVAGERRWRAAEIAGLDEVPCMVRRMTFAKAVEICIVENAQREDLTPIEEARGFAEWLALPAESGRKKKRTQADLAARIGKSQEYVSKVGRLLVLPEGIQALVEEGVLGWTQAYEFFVPFVGAPEGTADFWASAATEVRKAASWSNRDLRNLLALLAPVDDDSDGENRAPQAAEAPAAAGADADDSVMLRVAPSALVEAAVLPAAPAPDGGVEPSRAAAEAPVMAAVGQREAPAPPAAAALPALSIDVCRALGDAFVARRLADSLGHNCVFSAADSRLASLASARFADAVALVHDVADRFAAGAGSDRVRAALREACGISAEPDAPAASAPPRAEAHAWTPYELATGDAVCDGCEDGVLYVSVCTGCRGELGVQCTCEDDGMRFLCTSCNPAACVDLGLPVGVLPEPTPAAQAHHGPVRTGRTGLATKRTKAALAEPGALLDLRLVHLRESLEAMRKAPDEWSARRAALVAGRRYRAFFPWLVGPGDSGIGDLGPQDFELLDELAERLEAPAPEDLEMEALDARIADTDATCRFCRCTDSRACSEGCTWIELDRKARVGVCSSEGCVAALEAERNALLPAEGPTDADAAAVLEAYGAAVLAGDADEADRLRAEFDRLTVAIHGGPMGSYDVTNRVLEEGRASDGDVPRWGQRGWFRIDVAGVSVAIRHDPVSAGDVHHFEIEAAEAGRSVSPTGYRSHHPHAVAGMAVDEFAAALVLALVLENGGWASVEASPHRREAIAEAAALPLASSWTPDPEVVARAHAHADYSWIKVGTVGDLNTKNAFARAPADLLAVVLFECVTEGGKHASRIKAIRAQLKKLKTAGALPLVRARAERHLAADRIPAWVRQHPKGNEFPVDVIRERARQVGDNYAQAHGGDAWWTAQGYERGALGDPAATPEIEKKRATAAVLERESYLFGHAAGEHERLAGPPAAEEGPSAGASATAPDNRECEDCSGRPHAELYCAGAEAAGRCPREIASGTQAEVAVKMLRAALVPWPGARARWDAQRAAGPLTDQQVLAAVASEMGDDTRVEWEPRKYGCTSPDPGWLLSLDPPAFWWGSWALSARPREPVLQGQALLEAMREVLGLAPAPAEPPAIAPDLFTAAAPNGPRWNLDDAQLMNLVARGQAELRARKGYGQFHTALSAFRDAVHAHAGGQTLESLARIYDNPSDLEARREGWEFAERERAAAIERREAA